MYAAAQREVNAVGAAYGFEIVLLAIAAIGLFLLWPTLKAAFERAKVAQGQGKQSATFSAVAPVRAIIAELAVIEAKMLAMGDSPESVHLYVDQHINAKLVSTDPGFSKPATESAK